MKNDVISVFGKKGYGKTTFIKKYLLPKYQKKIILDTMEEYHNDKSLVTGSALETVEIVEYMLEQEKDFTIVQQSSFNEYEQLLDVVIQIPELTLVIDEIDKFGEPNSIHPALKELYNTARHYQINLIGASRRPNQVNRIITSQSDLIIIFHTSEPSDLIYYKHYISKEIIERIRNLKKYEYLWYGDDEIALKLGLTPTKELN